MRDNSKATDSMTTRTMATDKGAFASSSLAVHVEFIAKEKANNFFSS